MGSSPPHNVFRNEFHGTDAVSAQAIQSIDKWRTIWQGPSQYLIGLCYMGLYENPYERSRPPQPAATGPSELGILRQHHEFLRDTEEDKAALKWEQRVARNYYDQLYREFCLCDLRRYTEGKVAMRWRTESEVLSGKGESSCASLRCTNADALQTWEVMFNYVEQDERKRALVKLTLCPSCSQRLNHRHQHRQPKPSELHPWAIKPAAASLETQFVATRSRFIDATAVLRSWPRLTPAVTYLRF
ncbi:hypothetical protein H4R34_001654 [Dimargaris verticillata]|uniref:Folate-sensitive fragile site protein Fra10Ac1-domain-containing protein n=1 Tax=Dimargaris verticillata TaxID=2761393 RepID=A0A9W8B814_9FUNG|nr:hypothetical protein H4R34_001654 [Dimargaris verticillata]